MFTLLFGMTVGFGMGWLFKNDVTEATVKKTANAIKAFLRD